MEVMKKICVYETDTIFHIVGSNDSETSFRLLEVDRQVPSKLVISDDKEIYNKAGIQKRIDGFKPDTRSPSDKQRKSQGFLQVISTFGIIGFVKFTEGYYMILVTKRKRVAVIGAHTIYKIEDTTMIYIPEAGFKSPSNEESRYLKTFQNIDLSSNFYFCYSYDLTHSLQHNLTCHSPDDSPKKKFVWNLYHWEEAKSLVHPAWYLHVIHGFVGQVNVCIFGRSVYVALIARRSNRYAGTRYLKRGSNAQLLMNYRRRVHFGRPRLGYWLSTTYVEQVERLLQAGNICRLLQEATENSFVQGDVANEVETEQIVYDASMTSFNRGRYTSFLQFRGSVPGLWSQDISSMVPKPPITLNAPDPYYCHAAAHFNKALKVYGSPIIIINLVKKHEKRARESILTDELVGAIHYLNQFLPPEHCIRYKAFDMAKYKKHPQLDVIAKLESIAESVVKETGLFLFGPVLDTSMQKPSRNFSTEERIVYKQTGVVRTNCVDCLDRTNTAQFMIGKHALGHQLFALGFVSKTHLEFDTDCVRMLSEVYEEMGDTLAIQYGGSHLVHSVDSYRKLSPWTAQSRDIKMTVSRYYRNAFSDADKQNAINLFLGVFRPTPYEKTHLWDLDTDFYLHHKDSSPERSRRKSNTHWFEDSVIESLPLPDEETKAASDGHHLDEVDIFTEYYQEQELTTMDDLFCISSLPHSIRDYKPKTTSDISPFRVRISQPQRKEETSHHSIFGRPFSRDSAKSSPSGDASSSEDSSSSSDESVSVRSDESEQIDDAAPLKMEDVFPTMQQTYGVELTEPSKEATALYQNFVTRGTVAQEEIKQVKSRSGQMVPHSPLTSTNLLPSTSFPTGSIFEVTPPVVTVDCLEEYRAYVQRGTLGGVTCSQENYQIYMNYLRKL